MSENLEPDKEQPEIIRNDNVPNDSTVVVEEEHRTVVLTDKETIVIEKEPKIDIAPKNRPHRVNLGMWGRSEIAAIALGLLSLVATLLFYMFVVSPAKTELARHETERNLLAAELASETQKFQNFTTTEDQVAVLNRSVTDFEARFLPVADFGRTALYQRLNTLIAGYGLVNTSGPDYSPLEANVKQSQNESERGRAKFQNYFPGVYVTMTVEGSYQNLRRFVRELETGNQFVIISAVEFEPTENESNQATTTSATVTQPKVLNQGQKFEQPVQDVNGFPMNNPPMNNPTQTVKTQVVRPARPRGKTVGETVSLRIELAAYFKRGSAEIAPRR